ncbi:MAG: ABC transporter permease [Anaerolineaceae bacterium]|jgi:peptide/nickel transport system permease protein
MGEALPAEIAKLAGELPERKIGRLEKIIGPEFYRIYRGIFNNSMSVAGLCLMAFFILIAIIAPLICPAPINARGNTFMIAQIPRDGFGGTPRGPGSEWNRTAPPPAIWMTLFGQTKWVHVFGTASGQYDIFYGVIWGTRTAIFVGVIVVGICIIIGILLGSISSYYGGWVDEVLMRITEIFMAFPFIMAALTLSAILSPIIGRGIWAPVIALVVFGWMGYARLIRGDILSVREREYVMAARVVGVKDMRILVRHIIPNAVYPVLVVASMDIGSIVISFAALSFLGIGTEVGYPDWGQLISFARDWIPALSTYWYIVVFPGIALLMFTMGWNLMGDALRDIMDPRMRGRGA